MTEAASIIDVELITNRARLLWRRASGKAGTAGVELYVKTSSRLRVSREADGSGVALQYVRESGHALRVIPRGSDHAGFAASSGLTEAAADWTLDAAMNRSSPQLALVPRAADIAAERFDLDPPATIPPENDFRAALVGRPFLRSVEAGITLETLIGADGWIAVRCRNRVWGVAQTPRVRLVAQRGFARWEACLDAGAETSRVAPIADRMEAWGALEFSGDAAAPVVIALVDRFHGPSANQKLRVGAAWEVADEADRADGLSGGTFDDSGFPTARRVLAARGEWVGNLAAPGTFRRGSFREAPVESPSNLVLAAPDQEITLEKNAIHVSHSRVLRLSPDLWVLELDIATGRRWLRVEPSRLLAACTHRLGAATVTSVGPIVPSLRFDGLELS